MLFQKVKQCNDDRVIQAGLDVLVDFKNVGTNVQAFGCCFVKDTLVISFGYGNPYPQNIQTAMAVKVAERLPQEKKYKKVEYYPADKFDAECSKHCKGLWIKVQE